MFNNGFGFTGGGGGSTPPSDTCWALNGNTVGSEKWIGTIDNFDFPIYTNNTRRMTVAKDGWVGINQAAAVGLERFYVNGYSVLNGRVDVLEDIYFEGSGFSRLNSASGTYFLNAIFANGFQFKNTGSVNQLSCNVDGNGGNYITFLNSAGKFKDAGAVDTTIYFQIPTISTFSLGLTAASSSATLHIKGSTADATAHGLKIQNSSNVVSLQVRNDGSVYNLGKGAVVTNTAFGIRALISNTIGADNAAYGLDSLGSNTEGTHNVAMGGSSLFANTTGVQNVAVGSLSLMGNIIGNYNVAIGYSALVAATGSGNSAIGHRSMFSCTSGEDNVAIGADSLYTNNTGANNTGIGRYAGFGNVGSRNVFIGYGAGFRQSTSSDMMLISTRLYGDAAEELAKALVYGVFDAAVANQRFNVNGWFKIQPQTNVTEEKSGDTVNTTDATQTTAQTIAIPTDKVVSLECTITYRKTGGVGAGTTGDGTSIILTTSAKNVGGTVTLDTIQNTYTGTLIAGFAATLDVSTTNVRVRVTGAADDNVTWNVITKMNTV